jgi:hypothetical protein
MRGSNSYQQPSTVSGEAQVATALGMTEEAAMHYLTDAVDRDDVVFGAEV